MVKKENTIMQSKSEIRKKRPKERDEYADDLILEFLDRNPNGVTIKQIAGKTQLSRNTVMKHIERLVAYRTVRKRDFGYVALYYKGGYLDEGSGETHEFSDETKFSFQLVNRGADGNFIYIQERQISDFREEKVTGGIMIKTDDAQKFVKLLHTFAMKAETIESGR